MDMLQKLLSSRKFLLGTIILPLFLIINSLWIHIDQATVETITIAILGVVGVEGAADIVSRARRQSETIESIINQVKEDLKREQK